MFQSQPTLGGLLPTVGLSQPESGRGREVYQDIWGSSFPLFLLVSISFLWFYEKIRVSPSCHTQFCMITVRLMVLRIAHEFKQLCFWFCGVLKSICMPMCICQCVKMSAVFFRGLKRISDSLELDLLEVVSHLKWVLGAESGSFTRVANALIHSASCIFD